MGDDGGYLLGLGFGDSDELPRLPTSVTVLAVVLRLVGVLGLLDCAEVRVSAEWEGATFEPAPGMVSLLGSSGRELVASRAAFSPEDLYGIIQSTQLFNMRLEG